MLCVYQGSLHDVSPQFLQQTLDKKLMSNMRVSLALAFDDDCTKHYSR